MRARFSSRSFSSVIAFQVARDDFKALSEVSYHKPSHACEDQHDSKINFLKFCLTGLLISVRAFVTTEVTLWSSFLRSTYSHAHSILRGNKNKILKFCVTPCFTSVKPLVWTGTNLWSCVSRCSSRVWGWSWQQASISFILLCPNKAQIASDFAWIAFKTYHLLVFVLSYTIIHIIDQFKPRYHPS